MKKIQSTAKRIIMLVLLIMFILPMIHQTTTHAAEKITHNFYEIPVTVGEHSDWPLSGILTMPKTASTDRPVPAVILVHGSGPSDLNGNAPLFHPDIRPFYDLANFLSAHDIAVLRYDNRNFAHGVHMAANYGATFTVIQETVAPALYAAELLRNDPRISYVYLLGLSLGGMVAPRIHAIGGDFDGIILMAASSRDPREISMTQNLLAFEIAEEQIKLQTAQMLMLAEMGDVDLLQTLLGLPPETTQDEIIVFIHMIYENAMTELTQIPKQLETTQKLFDSISYMSTAKAQSVLVDPNIGMYAYYWLDIINHSFELYIDAVDVPMLIMQGLNDFTILADIDFARLQNRLYERENVRFRLYHGLNHLFMPSSATNIQESFQEYAFPAQMSVHVLRDIADWIHMNTVS